MELPQPRPALLLRRSLPRTRQGRAHSFFPTASVQDVHILGDAVQALLNLLQHFCRRVRVGARRTPSGPPLTEGRLDAVLHLLQLQPTRHWCNERPSSSIWVAVTVAGVSQSHRESDPQTGSSFCTPTEQVAMAVEVPQGERPADGVFSLHRPRPA